MSAPEAIVSWRGSLLKTRTVSREASTAEVLSAVASVAPAGTCSGGCFAFVAVRLLADRPAIFRLDQAEDCRMDYKLLPAATHFAYALPGEKRSETARQAVR